ncbi:MAG: heparinase II/III-family protein [Clostridiales bacterium]|nr:heparinase II/III-family protein [Clostridiales bacterium]
MLLEEVDLALDGGFLLSRKAFHPLPRIDERDVWDNLDPETKAYYAGQAQALVGSPIPLLTARMYAEYCVSGDRQMFEKAYFERRRRLFALCMCECLENTGRYIPDIEDLIWAICEETTWVVPAHLYQNPSGDGRVRFLADPGLARNYIDLFAAETASVLSWTNYLLGCRLKAEVVSRLEWEVSDRILDVYVARPEMYWTGFNEGRSLNNWTSWIYSNLLAVTLLNVDDDSRREALIRLIAKGLDAFLATYSLDGGCDEGAGYFDKAGASLLDCLEILDNATQGHAVLWNSPLIANMASYIMYAHIDRDYYINFADCGCRVRPDAMLLRRAAQKMGQDALKAHAEYLLANSWAALPYSAGYDSIYRRLVDCVSFMRSGLTSKGEDKPLSHYFSGTQVAVARQNANGSGLYLAAKGGHNAESHNHNDIGSYIIYVNGEPFIVDAGVGTYRRETFSSARYEIWTMQSRYHNTAIIGERHQLPGAACRAEGASFTDDGVRACFSLDISKAYGDFAPIDSYQRRITLDRDAGEISITDEVALSEEEAVTLPVMCAYEPRIAPGQAQLRGKNALLSIVFDPSVFSVTCEEVPLTDSRLKAAWERDSLYRLLFTVQTPSLKQQLNLKFMI